MPCNACFEKSDLFLAHYPACRLDFLINVRTLSLWHVRVYPKVTSFFKLYKVSVPRVMIFIAHIPKGPLLHLLIYLFSLNLSRKRKNQKWFSPSSFCVLASARHKSRTEKPIGLRLWLLGIVGLHRVTRSRCPRVVVGTPAPSRRGGMFVFLATAPAG